MRRLLLVIAVLLVALLLVGAPASLAKPGPGVTIELLNPPSHGLLELAVGQSYTFDILVESDEPFIMAVAMTDAYYPGRGVFWNGSDRASRGVSALLHLTIAGRNPTADLWAVCDWPEPGTCWPQGEAPVAIVAGVRFQGGQTVGETFAFAVRVP